MPTTPSMPSTQWGQQRKPRGDPTQSMNIPRTNTQPKWGAAKIMMGLGGFRDAKSVSPVRSNIACLCDLQAAFMWLLKARWMAVIDLDLIDSFSMVENTPQPKWTHHVRSFWCPKIILEAVECSRLAINLTTRIMCWCIWHHWCMTSSRGNPGNCNLATTSNSHKQSSTEDSQHLHNRKWSQPPLKRLDWPHQEDYHQLWCSL